ncbi:MAG: cell wall hydrolase [Rhodospirillales bacterium]|nr:cell wall hydrolase [Rhodospirillales bacterium]
MLGLKGLGRLGAATAAGFGRLGLRYPGPVLALFLAFLTGVVLVYGPRPPATYVAVDTTADLECLALNIYHEARSEPEAGKLAVGHVVLNRALDPRFPGSLCEVIKQGGESPLRACQFSWWCDGKSDLPRDDDAWAQSRILADLIFNGGSRDPTGGALWYHADYVDPPWRDKLVEGPKIGRHLFYFAN